MQKDVFPSQIQFSCEELRRAPCKTPQGPFSLWLDFFLLVWVFYSLPVVNCLSLSCTLEMMLQPSLFPLFLSLPPFPMSHLHCSFLPLCEQTQTQLEHARIRELEQSLLFEKAQAEKLLRELEDTRVMHPHLPCLQTALALPWCS